MKPDTNLTLARKLSFIETLLAWTGEVHAGAVAEYFHVARQTAQGFIEAYRNAFPGQMDYDFRRKRHVPSASFEPKLTNANALCFLDFIRGQTLAGRFWDSDSVSDVPLTDVDRLGRPALLNNIVRIILTGLSGRKRVSMRYQGKETDPRSVTWRMISPNHLVHADNRYHIRAYCHERHAYRDFVISRILHAELQVDEKSECEWVSGRGDMDWYARITLKFQPNPKLSETQIPAVTNGYNLEVDGCCHIATSRALAYYVKRKMLAIDQELGLARWCLQDEKSELLGLQ